MPTGSRSGRLTFRPESLVRARPGADTVEREIQNAAGRCRQGRKDTNGELLSEDCTQQKKPRTIPGLRFGWRLKDQYLGGTADPPQPPPPEPPAPQPKR
jgi:hypothetical protein